MDIKKLLKALGLMLAILAPLTGCGGGYDIPHTTHSICRLRPILPLRKTSEPRSRYGNSNHPII